MPERTRSWWSRSAAAAVVLAAGLACARSDVGAPRVAAALQTGLPDPGRARAPAVSRRAGTASTSAGPQDSIPVLLIPGWSDDEERLAALGARLTSAGWAPDKVELLSFEDPVGSNRDHAREIAEAVLGLKARSGAERIDIVAHSMGGLATRYYLQNGGDEHVRRVVFLATPHRGTVSAHFAWGEGAREMEPRSPFLLGLLRAHAVPPGVRAITIRTPLDLHIVPLESAILPGIPNLEVCCPTHAGLLDDDETFELIARFLKDTR